LEAQVKNLLYCLFFVCSLLLASCANATDATPTPIPAPEETGEPAPAATPTILVPEQGTEESSGYPPPGEDDSYPAPGDQPGYPAPPVPAPTLDPYPSGVVWIIRPVGEQCEDGRSFADLATAVSSLEENGIVVGEAEEVELFVCQACGCPTSEHYRLQIEPADLDRALTLGWFREE
jgi:hypothetical protein